jgi:hypothetical protein
VPAPVAVRLADDGVRGEDGLLDLGRRVDRRRRAAVAEAAAWSGVEAAFDAVDAGEGAAVLVACAGARPDWHDVVELGPV